MNFFEFGYLFSCWSRDYWLCDRVAEEEIVMIQKGMKNTLASFTGLIVGHSHSRGITNVHRESKHKVDSIVILGQYSGKIISESR